MQDKMYWKQLTQRYFEAETTRSEEEMLKRFAAATDDPEFDELRAVMGYLAVGRNFHSHRMPWYRWAGIAVVAVLCLLPLAHYLTLANEEDICVAYVNGRRMTDTEEVMRLMEQALSDVVSDEQMLSVEEQLNDLFRTIE